MSAIRPVQPAKLTNSLRSAQVAILWQCSLTENAIAETGCTSMTYRYPAETATALALLAKDLYLLIVHLAEEVGHY